MNLFNHPASWTSAFRTDRRHLRLATVALALLILSSCYFPERHIPGFSVEISDPRDGAVLLVGASKQILIFVHSAEPIDELTLYASGRRVGSAEIVRPSASAIDPGFIASVEWTPRSPGEYFLNAIVSRSGPDVASAPVRVCVIENIDAGVILDFGFTYGYEGPCDFPPPHELAEAEAEVNALVNWWPDPITYNANPPIGIASCPVVEDPRLHFEVQMTDASDEVAFAFATYWAIGLPTGIEPGDTDIATLVLNRTGGIFPEKLYTGTSMTLDAMFTDVFGYGCGDLNVRITAIGRDGSVVYAKQGIIRVCDTCIDGVSASITSAPPMTATSSVQPRCELFAAIPIELITLEWKPGTQLDFYLWLPGGVPGLEKPIAGDSDPWNYSVRWGAYSTDECSFIPGYPERLYCSIEFPSEYANSKQDLELSLEGCELPVYKNPRAEVPEYAGPPPGGEGGEGGTDCAQYGDLNACVAAGCAWDFNGNACK